MSCYKETWSFEIRTFGLIKDTSFRGNMEYSLIPKICVHVNVHIIFWFLEFGKIPIVLCIHGAWDEAFVESVACKIEKEWKTALAIRPWAIWLQVHYLHRGPWDPGWCNHDFQETLWSSLADTNGYNLWCTRLDAFPERPSSSFDYRNDDRSCQIGNGEALADGGNIVGDFWINACSNVSF